MIWESHSNWWNPLTRGVGEYVSMRQRTKDVLQSQQQEEEA